MVPLKVVGWRSSASCVAILLEVPATTPSPDIFLFNIRTKTICLALASRLLSRISELVDAKMINRRLIIIGGTNDFDSPIH